MLNETVRRNFADYQVYQIGGVHPLPKGLLGLYV